MNSPLISAAELHERLQSESPPLVVDCTFHLDNTTLGQEQFEATHIAGAIYADLDHDLSAADAGHAVNGGRHPLPTREAFAQTLGRLGVSPGRTVVVYDRIGTLVAGRLWWMLRWCGHADVAILDGGLSAWQATGGALASGPNPPHVTGVYPLGEPLETLILQDQVVEALGTKQQTLVDARGGPRYRGEVEPLDPVAGHIPGALNRPFTDNFQADGRFKSAQTLREEWAALLNGHSSETVVAYCGSGVSAVPNLVGLAIAGLPAKGLYAGSWSEWCRTPGLTCAKG
jgi:thiosulfate/3-mercaptopyruvate sulfurtransferase